MTGRTSRRALLGSLAAIGVPLAGCGGDGGGPPTTSADTGDATDGDGGSGGTDGAGDGGSTATDGQGTPIGDLAVDATTIAEGFAAPVGVETPQPGRHFVVDQAGRIELIDADGAERHTFLDVRDRMVDLSGYEERGLLGLAFHPEYDSNGRFYVRYSAPPDGGTPANYDHRFVLSEFTADPGGTSADPGSERTVLEIPQPQANHNAGDIVFGPDGSLFVSVGDGGGADDSGLGHVDDWYEPTPGGNGQDVTENLLGSVLRIDVDGRDGDRGYAIPSSNPLVGREGLDEHFAWGLRNPWRMSVDPQGRLIAGDVGQNRWEEVNVVEAGGNYGWNVREGRFCFQSDGCPDVTADGEQLRDPVIQYGRGDDPVSGIAVVGGYVYRGSGVPAIDGLYVFADWQADGRLFAARPSDDGTWTSGVLEVTADGFGPLVLGFGEDTEGELLVCTTGSPQPQGSTGALYRLETA